MTVSEQKLTVLTVSLLILSITALFIEQLNLPNTLFFIFTNILDFLILFFLVIEVYLEFKSAAYITLYIRKNILSLLFVAVFIVLFAYNKIILFSASGQTSSVNAMLILIIRNLFLLFKVLTRFKKLRVFVESIHIHPAQTILTSFLLVILGGMLLLMLPFTAAEGHGLSFLNALFTATSAVCVTGLVVVDTATSFSIWGKVVIMTMIQIGGLGIMILSFFTVFVLRRSMSVEDKILISYTLNDDDMSSITETLKSIVGTTFFIEAIGALMLMAGFIKHTSLSIGRSLFYAVFHAVSAFCNAGFALFTDSLEGFNNSFLITGGIACLVIVGGISFPVLVNIRSVFHDKIRLRKKKRGIAAKVTLNTKIVLRLTAFLLISGMFLFYAIEHGGTLRNMSLSAQYFTAFFQSVTLRTAGFNSVSFSHIASPMLIIIMIYMFIGAASGSTAGGIKINTVAILGAAVQSAWRNEKTVMFSKKVISSEMVMKAFLIFLFGVMTVVIGTAVLTVTENAPFEKIMFEVVSAFGTVGLSTGLTPNLSSPGRCVIIIIMFIGRLGPLTLLAAASRGVHKLKVTYPQAEISIG